MSFNCYETAAEPGMMTTMVCHETATALPSREEIQALYESHMTTYMADLKEAYTGYVQAVADLDLINFQLQTLASRIANEQITIKAGLAPSSDYSNMIERTKFLESQKTAKNLEISNYQASLDRLAFDIKNYMTTMKAQLDNYAIPTATYEQTFALVKSEVPAIPSLMPPVTMTTAISTVPVPPQIVQQTSIPLADLKAEAVIPAKNNMPLIAGALIGLLMLARRR